MGIEEDYREAKKFDRSLIPKTLALIQSFNTHYFGDCKIVVMKASDSIMLRYATFLQTGIWEIYIQGSIQQPSVVASNPATDFSLNQRQNLSNKLVMLLLDDAQIQEMYRPHSNSEFHPDFVIATYPMTITDIQNSIVVDEALLFFTDSIKSYRQYTQVVNSIRIEEDVEDSIEGSGVSYWQKLREYDKFPPDNVHHDFHSSLTCYQESSEDPSIWSNDVYGT